jgi:hypothetical protein
MTALQPRRRVAAPAYYHGRPASFWITYMSPRRRGPQRTALRSQVRPAPEAIDAQPEEVNASLY